MASSNYKRLIAYACVSSSGVIALGLSVGQAAYGVVLYIVSNVFIKSLLFLTAGRMRSVYHTNEVGLHPPLGLQPERACALPCVRGRWRV